eukprot:scaffold119055_cov16-Tisochrysis_lutea.AAC.1
MISRIRGVAESRQGHASSSLTEYLTSHGLSGGVGRSLGISTCSKFIKKRNHIQELQGICPCPPGGVVHSLGTSTRSMMKEKKSIRRLVLPGDKHLQHVNAKMMEETLPQSTALQEHNTEPVRERFKTCSKLMGKSCQIARALNASHGLSGKMGDNWGSGRAAVVVKKAKCWFHASKFFEERIDGLQPVQAGTS